MHHSKKIKRTWYPVKYVGLTVWSECRLTHLRVAGSFPGHENLESHWGTIRPLQDCVSLIVPGRPSTQGHFFQKSLASLSYGQIAPYFDMLRKIG